MFIVDTIPSSLIHLFPHPLSVSPRQDFVRLDSSSDPSNVLKDTYEIAFVLQRSSSDAPVRLSNSASTSDSKRIDVISKVTTKTTTTTTTPPTTDPKNSESEVSLQSFQILEDCFHLNAHKDGGDGGGGSGDGNEDIILKYSPTLSNWQPLFYEHIVEEPGFLHLYFSNCEPETSVSFQMELIEYNINADGSRMYLSAGERYLPSLLVVLASAFLIELLVWSIYLKRHLEHVKTIHWLMLLCVFIKMMSVGFEAMKYHSLKAHGKHDGWIYAYYVVSILKSMFLFCVIVLLSTGWSYLKPFLTQRDRTILFATLMTQACVSIATVVVGEMQQGDPTWIRAHDILSILDMLCWCLILVPIVWSIRSLRESASEDVEKDEMRSVGRSMHRLKAFRAFYLLVIGFIYFTRIVVFLMSLTLPFELVWLSSAFAEMAALLFYALTGFLFRPMTSNPYLAIEVDEDEMDGLKEEEEDEEVEGEVEMSITTSTSQTTSQQTQQTNASTTAV